MTIDPPKSVQRRRGWTFDELATALGISNSALRRWARRKKKDGTSRVLGAHFIRGRWVLLGKLTPKRVESIRSGLNLHKPPSEAPKKKKRTIRSKEERLAILDQQIQKLERDYDDLPGTQGDWTRASSASFDLSDGLVQKEKRRIGDKWRKLRLKKMRLLHGKSYQGLPQIEFRHFSAIEDEIAAGRL